MRLVWLLAWLLLRIFAFNWLTRSWNNLSKGCYSWSSPRRSQSQAGRGRGAWAVQSSETERITSNNNQTSLEPSPGGSRNPAQSTQFKVSFIFCQAFQWNLRRWFFLLLYKIRSYCKRTSIAFLLFPVIMYWTMIGPECSLIKMWLESDWTV